MATISKTDKRIRIMLVEDHILMRMGLVSAAQVEPDMVVVAETEDSQGALAGFREHRPDVTIVDLRLGGEDGMAVIKLLRQESPEARILVLTSYGGGDDVSRAVENGALGYVLKSMPVARVLEAVRAIHAGGQYFPQEIANRLNERIRSQLSSRELEVLRLISQGRSNKEIASALGIAEGTVKVHATHIFAKLGALDRMQAITIAVKRKILQIE
jgi:DNA-binding NarL/FixJ family response regulator